jgi:hypothetical protein
MQNLTKNRQGYLISDTHRECTKCKAIFEITSRQVVMCKTCNCTRVKAHDLRKKMIARAKNRTKVNGLELSISYTDLVIPTHCPILGIPLEASVGSPGGTPGSPSLDRIDNTKGYIKGNIQVISHLANQMKAQASKEELVRFAKWVLAEYNELS